MNRTDTCCRHVAEPRPALACIAEKIWSRLLHWQDVANQRRELRELDARSLRDIGIKREDALREARRTFWDIPQC